MAKSKRIRILPPKNIWVGVGCYSNCRREINNRISCEKFTKIGAVKLQLHASEVIRLYNGQAN